MDNIGIAEEPDALVGVDPEDTAEVSYGKATFTIGVIPAAAWQRISTRAMVNRIEAGRRCIARLAADGVDPEGLEPGGSGLSNLDMAIAYDPDFSAAQLEAHLEAARYSVKAHARFRNRKGTEFVCELGTDGLLSPKTLRIYEANHSLLSALWIHIRRLNELTLIGKKD